MPADLAALAPAAWFAGSMVVDAEGRPRLLFHGGTRFDRFSETPEAGAHYASEDIESAHGFAAQYPPAEAEIKPLWLRAVNLLDLTDPARFAEWTGRDPSRGAFGSPERNMAANSPCGSGSGLLARAKAAGHDAVRFLDTQADGRGCHLAYAFFDPSQVRPGLEADTPKRWWDHDVRQDGLYAAELLGPEHSLYPIARHCLRDPRAPTTPDRSSPLMRP